MYAGSVSSLIIFGQERIIKRTAYMPAVFFACVFLRRIVDRPLLTASFFYFFHQVAFPVAVHFWLVAILAKILRYKVFVDKVVHKWECRLHHNQRVHNQEEYGKGSAHHSAKLRKFRAVLA